MSSDAIIEVQGLSKSYAIYAAPHDRLKQMVLPRLQRSLGLPPRSYFQTFAALRDVSFDVRPGETVGILGRNGSGKSTLLKIISGVLAPTCGSVKVRGRAAALLELGSGFNPEFTGRENAALSAQIHGADRSDIIGEIEAFADIGDFFDRPVKTYSSGMQIRVAFAAHACIEPDLLIIDEALAVGDERFQRKCFARLEQLRSRGTAILLVTHATSVVERFCERALLLESGQAVAFGASREIVDLYHAQLYAEPEAYRKLVTDWRNGLRANAKPPAVCHQDDHAAHAASARVEPITFVDGLPAGDEPHSSGRASISSVRILNSSGVEQENFEPGEAATIAVRVTCHTSIASVQTGINIKTVEGILAFGTSTLYFGGNQSDLRGGDELEVRFDLGVALCSGAYFVTVAVAVPTPDGAMEYLDKRTDVAFFRIEQVRIKASGIAYLPVAVSTQRLVA